MSTPPSGPFFATSVDAAQAETDIRTVVDDWHGTPYVWGGSVRSGLDCSAFMSVVYQDVYGIDLPRSTSRQVRLGRDVSKRALQTGDLVFFKPSRKVRHVGVYLSEGEFAHVSSSQGVTISHLEDTYWRERFWTARRLFEPSPSTPVAATPARQRAEPPPASSRRVGW